MPPVAGLPDLVEHPVHVAVRVMALSLLGVVISPDGSQYVRATADGGLKDAEALGRELGARLLRDGAKAILEAVYNG